jgi:hypothetical protein
MITALLTILVAFSGLLFYLRLGRVRLLSTLPGPPRRSLLAGKLLKVYESPISV